MKLRIASIAFLLASAATGVTWLSLQPLLVRLLDVVRRVSPPNGSERVVLARVQAALPVYLATDLLVVGVLAFVVLYFAVARPLEATERQVARLENLHLEMPLAEEGGPLLSRLQASLNRAAEALAQERAVTRKQLEDLQASHQQLTHAQMELVASERLATVGKLAAGVAHEVGNPLSGILGYLSLVRGQVQGGTPELAEFLGHIDEEVQRISGIVRGLLDLGRPTSASPAPVDLSRLVHTCVKLVSAGPDFLNVRVEVELPANVLVLGEPGPLSQVLINLMLNAAQAQEGRGEIHLSGRAEGGFFLLDVTDRGPGIPGEVASRLFEPFFTTKSAGKGTGLGLTISQHIVQSLGGELTARNVEGGGGRFTVRLPRVPPAVN